MFHATMLTLFPAMFPGPLGLSLAGDALARVFGGLRRATFASRAWAASRGRRYARRRRPRHGDARRRDRRRVRRPVDPDDPRPRLIMSPRGPALTQARANGLARARPSSSLRRFEGVDERVIVGGGLMRISIGDYILSGGEVAAWWSWTPASGYSRRHGQGASGVEESFRRACSNIPTLPARANGRAGRFPTCCSSGDHANGPARRRAEAERITSERRPDLAEK